ncbi:AMP-binding protein [Nonomuraea fuscirosea]
MKGLSRRGLLGGAAAATGAVAVTLMDDADAAATRARDRGPAAAPATVYPSDPRYQELTVGYNQRWVGRPDYVRVVSSTEQVVAAVQEAVDTGRRVSVVSGGHCLAPFVFNDEVKMVIDLAGLNDVYFDTRRGAFAVEGGARLSNVYETLYKKWGVTIPGGMCPTVGIGGHTTGGGYGFLSRQFGAVIDHLAAVEVVVVDRSRTARAIVATSDPDDPHHSLWWACAGGGGGNFGVVTRFWFRTPGRTGSDPGGLLVNPPKDVLLSAVGIPWSMLDRAKFTALVTNWGAWYESAAAPSSPARALSGVASLAHRSAQNVFLLTQVDAATPGAEAPEPIDEPVGLDDVCLIMYTSGTTGHPKGAMLTHGNLTWNTVNLLVDVPLAHDEVVLISAPLFHIAALAQTLVPSVLKGGRVILEPSFDVERTFDLIESERVTVMFGVPSMFGFLTHSPRWDKADLSSLRHLLCGGAPVPEPLIRTYQERGLMFLQGYGMTEAAPGALFLGAERSVDKAGTAGVPHFFSDVRLVAPDGSPAAPGEPGELYVQGPNVMPGYWRRPEASAEVLSADGWFRSGDVGVADEDGYVRISDRIKDVIISGGENVYPAEVEGALYEHAAVAECAVIGVPDQKWGEVGKALVVPRPGARAAPEELLKHLDGRLARYKIPKYVEFVAELPKNAAGKLLKAPLRELYGG